MRLLIQAFLSLRSGPLPTFTRTVVFTDLANYTAKVSRAGRQDLLKILDAHAALVTPIVERYGGRVVKNLGDSFMCLFDAATPALRAALDIQEFVNNESGQSIRLSMNTGDVEEIEGDAFGEAVNLAARILSKTPAGEVWFGPGTRLSMYGAEIPWESVGRYSLKGIPGMTEIFRAVSAHHCFLPDPVLQSIQRNTLYRLEQGTRPPLLPPDPVVVLEGFPPGSDALRKAVSMLPVLDPACLWLSAYNMAPVDRLLWLEQGRGLVIGTPAALENAIEEAQAVKQRPLGTDTIVLDIGSAAEIELVISGLALPAVPFSNVVASYAYDLLSDGRWVNRSERAVLRVEVTSEGVMLEAMSPGVTVDGRSAGHDPLKLSNGSTVRCSAGTLTFREVGQDYAGCILLDTGMVLGVSGTQTAELGREPNHPGLAFPDRRGQANIRWCVGQRSERARASGYTIDRALAGRRQASVRLVGGSIQVTPLHERCPTFMLRGGHDGMDRLTGTVNADVGDHIIAGTSVVHIREPE